MAQSLSQISTASGGSISGKDSTASLGLGLSGTGIGASPAANMLAYTSPAGASLLDGLNIGTPSMLNTDGTKMNISLSDLGLAGGKRNEDEEWRAKLATILDKLGKNKGRISEEGVRRIGSRYGFEEMIEEKTAGPEFEGSRTFTMAGNSALLIDFSFKENVPEKINVSFSSESPAVTAHEADAAKVMMRDLTPPRGVALINSKLDRFAENLDTLARLDRLGISGQLNCFEAITGVYTGLRKLYEHERKAAAALVDAEKGHTRTRAEREVLCKKSGRPRMHARAKIGLGLEFWMDQRHALVQRRKEKSNESSDMDVDDEEAPIEDMQQVYALQIGAEASSPDTYRPLRVSSEWVSDRIVKSTEGATDPNDMLAGASNIDWLDPADTYITETNQQSDAMAVDGATQPQKLPNARFVAKLLPPIVVPWTVASQVMQSVGVEMPTVLPATYDGALLRSANPADSAALHGIKPVLTSMSNILARNMDGQDRHVEHVNRLWVPKPDFAYTLQDVPFAHPRQLVEMLPTLRQWAFFGSLLRKTFAHKGVRPVPEGYDRQHSLEELLDDASTEGEPQSNIIDIQMSTSPIPSLTVLFDFSTLMDEPATITVQILPDAEILISEHNIPYKQGLNGKASPDKLARGLDLAGELGIWVEWIRLMYGEAA
ncbi:hypothetical protein M8818_004206 [Zalaria obscura]|uniref:Uncharacterized protein n=1 Tax=Zalaria obscura TaxID=2024903 RepID=A0ACC3SDA9_9PEZI